jgi:hypothetical protein
MKVEVTLVRPSRLLEVARGAILAAGALEFDGAPGRWRQAADLGENARCAPAQGDKGDPADIETIEAVIGGEKTRWRGRKTSSASSPLRMSAFE